MMSTPTIACPPVDKAEQLKIGIVGFAPGPDMIEGVCSRCQQRVWIGSQARKFQARNPSARVRCFGCAARAGHKEIKHLGGQGGHYLFDPRQVK